MNERLGTLVSDADHLNVLHSSLLVLLDVEPRGLADEGVDAAAETLVRAHRDNNELLLVVGKTGLRINFKVLVEEAVHAPGEGPRLFHGSLSLKKNCSELYA